MSKNNFPPATCSASRDYVDELRKYINNLPPEHDPLRTMEHVKHFANQVVERLKSEKTEAYFNEFLRHN